MTVTWILLNILTYCVIGLVTTFVIVVIHFYQAEKSGFKCIEWWKKHGDMINSGIDSPGVIFGLLLWPYRVYQAIKYTFPELYSMYDHYDNE
jgi:hypothetical protein